MDRGVREETVERCPTPVSFLFSFMFEAGVVIFLTVSLGQVMKTAFLSFIY